eukprot:8923185-Pyramimonas_sp.AAC.1
MDYGQNFEQNPQNKPLNKPGRTRNVGYSNSHSEPFEVDPRITSSDSIGGHQTGYVLHHKGVKPRSRRPKRPSTLIQQSTVDT